MRTAKSHRHRRAAKPISKIAIRASPDLVLTIPVPHRAGARKIRDSLELIVQLRDDIMQYARERYAQRQPQPDSPNPEERPEPGPDDLPRPPTAQADDGDSEFLQWFSTASDDPSFPSWDSEDFE
jgi:hypothetical protein